MHEFALVLDKAGFNADLVQQIVNSRANKMARAMYGSLAEPTKPVSAEPIVKFGLLVDLGTIVVPADYDHATCLVSFEKRHQGGKKKSFAYYNENRNDTNFRNPSRILKPGDKLWVRAFQQVVGGTTTSEERMKFLATQNAIHTGAQGLTVVFDQKHDQLPKGKWYSSFDEKDRLWRDSDRYHRVPRFDARSDGDFTWDLGCFERVWSDSYAFLCFCDLPKSEPSEA